jgi:hypothetical protein
MLDRLRRAQTAIAYAMKLDGPVYGPIFERLEREISLLRAADDVMARVRRRLESQEPPATKLIAASVKIAGRLLASGQPLTCEWLMAAAKLRRLSQSSCLLQAK